MLFREKPLVILFVSLCSSWCSRAVAADSEGIGGYSGSMLQIAVAVAIASELCVVDVWKTLERWSRGTEDGQGMACLPVYGIEWEDVLDNCQLVRLITTSRLPSPFYRRVHIWLWTSDRPSHSH